MAYKILITGADRGLGFAMCKQLLQKGHTVFAGQFMPDWKELDQLKLDYKNSLHIFPIDVGDRESVKEAKELVHKLTNQLDMLINNAAFYSENHDFNDMEKLYNINSLGPIRVTETFLPLLEGSPLKRLCFLSSEASSISKCERDSLFGYCMSKAALNMATKIFFNNLRPRGFTFRLHHPGYLQSYMHGFLNTNGQLTSDQAAQKALAIFLTAKKNEDQLNLIDYDGNVWEW